MENKFYSDLILEQYILQELPKNLQDEIELQVKGDIDLQRRLEDIRSSNRELAEQFPAEAMVAEILSKRKKKANGSAFSIKIPRLRILVPAMITAALILIISLPHLDVSKSEHLNRNRDILRTKGDEKPDKRRPEIHLFRKSRNQKIERLVSGAVAREGDLIQVAYKAGGEKYGIILSMDGKGILTLHFPEKRSGSCRLTQGKQVSLKHSYELDDAPEFERFWFISAAEKFSVDQVFHMIEKQKESAGSYRGLALSLPDKFIQSTITINKEGAGK